MSTTTIAAATEAGKAIFDLQVNLEVDLGSNLNNVTASAIRLEMAIRTQATAAVGDTMSGCWGVAWIGNDAIAAGGASIPSPNNDHADWMAHGTWLVVAETTSVRQMGNKTFPVVSDSQRKQRENHSTLLFVMEAVLLDDPITIFLGGRVLFLLP